ncbi:MAG: GAP family protein, partial [Bacteroidota bacterium]
MNTITYSLALSLFDSLSTAQQIVIFSLLLTTAKPLRNSLSYLAGLSGAYIICGVLGYLALGSLNEFLGKYVPNTASMSNTGYYQFECIVGAAMLLIGIWYYRKKRHAPAGRTQNIMVARLRNMNAWFPLIMGAFISVTSFPLSIPYIVALGKYATLQMSFPAAFSYILLYNLGYAFPMLIILFIYLYARKRAADLTDQLHEKTRVLNVQLTAWTLIGVGLFTMIDSGCYFVMGQALINGR